MRALPLLLVLFAACGGSSSSGSAVPATGVTHPAAELPGGAPAEPASQTPIADSYREVASRIMAAAEKDQGAWAKLEHLTDRIGHRLSGSRALDQAIAWAADAMRADGHENVRTEEVMVPHWERGAESARLVAPVERDIALLGLGGSPATPRGGLIAEAVVVRDFDELERLGAAGVKGKIVVFNHPMRTWTDQDTGPGYGDAVVYRTDGPSRAAKLGAVGALVRSITARSLRTPHTGATEFADGVKPIPAAAISIEDAELLARLAASGARPRVRLILSGRWRRPARSANVIGELRGRERPQEIVLIGAHIDSWDVGQGAHDDGAGVVIVMQALTLLRQLGLTPRRTIRVVLFTNEENGLRGATQYAADHAGEIADHVMALEADTGGFAPVGFQVAGDADAQRRAADIASLLAPIGATRTRPGYAGADVGPLVAAGVPGLGLWMDSSRYFDYHHSPADTLDKVNPEDIRRDVAAVAVMAYVVADMPDRLGKAPPPAAGDQ